MGRFQTIRKKCQQGPTLLWFHAIGRTMLGPTMLHVVGQQCCVRLHGGLKVTTIIPVRSSTGVPAAGFVYLSCMTYFKNYPLQHHQQLARNLYSFQVLLFCSDETIFKHSSIVNKPSHDISSSISFGKFSKNILSCIISYLIGLEL